MTGSHRALQVCYRYLSSHLGHYLECLIFTSRLCHLMWSKKGHNLPPQALMHDRGSPCSFQHQHTYQSKHIDVMQKISRKGLGFRRWWTLRAQKAENKLLEKGTCTKWGDVKYPLKSTFQAPVCGVALVCHKVWSLFSKLKRKQHCFSLCWKVCWCQISSPSWPKKCWIKNWCETV